MDITWLGHSCFRIKAKEASIVTDPFDRTLGYPMKKLTANIVTVSHSHPQHSFVESIGGDPRIVSSPGEYEIANVLIFGISTFHDQDRGETRGKNIIYLMEIEDIKVCHLGDLGHVPTSDQVEEIGDVDILMVPVGGVSTLGGAAAAETISLFSPKMIIPMHFKTEVVEIELEPVNRFLKEMGIREAIPQPKISVTKSNLPIETKVIVLDYS
ncbi:MBL fold metallo-hydrolase [Chloroflexota bacterium]